MYSFGLAGGERMQKLSCLQMTFSVHHGSMSVQLCVKVDHAQKIQVRLTLVPGMQKQMLLLLPLMQLQRRQRRRRLMRRQSNMALLQKLCREQDLQLIVSRGHRVTPLQEQRPLRYLHGRFAFAHSWRQDQCLT
jgi:hypothetical protein